LTPLRLGILGAARIAELAIVKPARATGTRLVAIAARDPQRAAAFAAAHGVERVAGSYADLLADPGIEAVYNPLPNALHGPWNLAAIGAGKPVLSEKPFAANAGEAIEVRDAGRRAGLVVADGFHYRYHHAADRRLLPRRRPAATAAIQSLSGAASPPHRPPALPAATAYSR
jgi:predicted dehydrogenase